MGTPTSSVPRAIAALMTLLETTDVLKDVKSYPSAVIPDKPPLEFVNLGRIADGVIATATQAARIGNQVRVEDYMLHLSISVGSGGYDVPPISDRAFDIFGALELALRVDPQLQSFSDSPIAQPFQVIVASHELSAFPVLDGGTGARITVDIDCSARLRLT